MVLFDVESVGRQVIREVIGTAADILYLPDVAATARAEVLRRATVILAQNTATELTLDELALIHQVRLLQFYTAGVDFIPLQELPADLPIATNGGAFAEPMAEHALALTLAAAKRLFVEHRQLPVFSAKYPPGHAPGKGLQSLVGAPLPGDVRGRSGH